MRTISRLALIAAVVGLSAAASPAVAGATPGHGVSAVTIFDQTVGDTQYVIREITIAPGGATGWHYHPGPVRGVVTKGVLTHHDADCSVDGVYRPGQFISERSGTGYVHIGRNLTDAPLVLTVFYENPAGEPLAVSTPNPGCSFE
ncbi:cupin domain-containing protein [Lentzea sp. BCCO 10_0061]|uniref:Cupin domain-containing protein n=1 Tax=Lentzea sokolovensis TaxID=3095429 RepID=A0ABU4URN2_9PSEU|nr:cupin domain-containing protein [Lentzea sp. BCCO 10_0061]MDX8142124.1 cupin domain-containing protein [Lentzea sp. BCCO 10_0061]